VVEIAGDSGVGLEVDASVDAALLRALADVGEVLEGSARVRGTFEWSGVSWGARATVEADRLVAAGIVVDELSGRLAADRGRVVLDIDRAQLWDGGLSGRIAYDPSAGANRHGNVVVEADLAQVSLAALLRVVGVPLRQLDGRASGPVELAFDVASWEAMVGRVRLTTAASEPRLGVLAGRIDAMAARGAVDLAWTLESPRHRVVGGGQIELPSLHGAIELDVNTAELGALLAALPWQVDADWWPTGGRGSLEAAIELASATTVRLDFDLVEALAEGWRADHLAGVVELSSTAAERLRIEAQLGEGAVLITGTAPFDQRPLELRFEAARWPASELQPWLPGRPPVGGVVTGSFDLRGTGEDWEGGFDVQLANASWASWTAGGSLVVRGGFADGGVHIEHAELDLPAGCVQASGSLDPSEELDFVLEATNLDLTKAPATSWLGRELPLKGTALARVSGTLGDPAIELNINAESPHGSGLVDLSWASGRVGIEAVLPGDVRLTGGGGLAAARTDLRFELDAPQLQPIAEMLELPAFDGFARGTLAVAVDAAGTVSADAELQQFGLEVGGLSLHALESVRAELRGGELAIESLYLGTADAGSEVFLAGSVGIDDGELDLVAQGSAGLEDLERLFGTSYAAVGRAELLTTVRGTLDAPRWRGQSAVRAERLAVPGLASPAEAVEAQILLDPGAIVLDQAVGRVATGSVRLQGRVDLVGLEPSTFRAQARAEGLTLRLQPGLTVAGDAELVWSGSSEQSAITGHVGLERASYVAVIETDPLRLLRSALQHQRLQVASADQALSTVQLSVGIGAPGTIRVRNNLARFDASADLVVRGTLARPAVFGRAQSLAGGTFEYSGNTYDIERGIVSFVDPLEIDPSLDLVASTRVGAYAVSLSVGGTLENLEVSFASDPPLPDLEVLALVAGGEGAAERLASAGDGGIQTGLRTQAESLLLGQAAALLERRVGTLFGLDSIQIEPLTTGGETLSSARVTVGRQINPRLRATYSWDPSSTEQQRLRVEWIAGEGWTLVLTQNGDGTYSVDSRWEQRF
jgi:autotransporter translocation and assembly factor TamB